MLGYPYVGQKTFDLLRVITWLKSCGHEEIHLVAKGWGAIPATFAALLSDTVSQVTLKTLFQVIVKLLEMRNITGLCQLCCLKC